MTASSALLAALGAARSLAAGRRRGRTSPPAFIGISPQSTGYRRRLRADAARRGAAASGCRCTGRRPAGKPARRRTRLRRLRPRGRARRRTGHPGHALRLRHAGMGGAANRIDLPVRERLAALGLDHLPARRGRALRPRRLLLGRKPRPALSADPRLGDLERGEHRHLRRTTPTRPLRDADADLGPGPAPCRPRRQGDPRRPLRPAAADPAQRRLRRLPLPPLPGAATSSRYFDGVALHPYVADAGAMGAQIANLRRIMRVHHDARARRST